ncbi:hypothetical protein [Hymenobacter ruricola]|uniref:MAM domain-containing protein n=1 Tax=Hymenobacter ruricola TaxID=2791023 RepID=A0ABS0I9P0_9BACT|nr:hypothetical protein [Hymenobacter ruricola]MBF9223666.1 hypothetical protein [Hymenobacter ruricola]
MNFRYPLLSLLALSSSLAHAQQAALPSARVEALPPPLHPEPAPRLNTSFEEASEPAISGSRLQPVRDPRYARTGTSSLLMVGGAARAYFSLSRLMPAQAGQPLTASLYVSYPAQPRAAAHLVQAASLAAAAYGQSPALAPLPAEQPGRATKRLFPYLGLGVSFTPCFRPSRRAVPQAYLSYSVYNADTVLVASGSSAVNRSARDDWQHLACTWTMPVDGFVQLAFVNESPRPVRVDDLSLLVAAPSPVGADSPADPNRKRGGSIANNSESNLDGGCLGEVVVGSPPFCEVYPEQCPPPPPPDEPDHNGPPEPNPNDPPDTTDPDSNPGVGAGPSECSVCKDACKTAYARAEVAYARAIAAANSDRTVAATALLAEIGACAGAAGGLVLKVSAEGLIVIVIPVIGEVVETGAVAIAVLTGLGVFATCGTVATLVYLNTIDHIDADVAAAEASHAQAYADYLSNTIGCGSCPTP